MAARGNKPGEVPYTIKDRPADPPIRVVDDYLTINEAQIGQPWTVPYARGVIDASKRDVPHILGTHCVLHASKSVGKLAAVFEAMDHPLNETGYGQSCASDAQLQTIKDMSADLFTVALRFANLYDFDLATELERRVKEKNP